MINTEEDKLKKDLVIFQEEHADLNKILDNNAECQKIDQLTLQRLKKRKLWLKDKIAEIKAQLYPDIIA